MNNAIRQKAFARLADRLQKLKEANFRRKAFLLHSLSLGEQISLPPQVTEYNGRRFGGVCGLRSNVLIPTKHIRTYPNGHKISGLMDWPAQACNSFRFDGECDEESWKKLQSKREDFFGIASEIGKILKSMIPDLREKFGVWEMWRRIESVDDKGAWIDFVFEVAWLAIPGFPLSATKYVYWNGVSYQMERFDELVSEFSPPRPAAEIHMPSMPTPIPAWYSEIDDIVSASQYALDLLIAPEGVRNDQDSNNELQPVMENLGEYDIQFLVAMLELNAIAQVSKKTIPQIVRQISSNADPNAGYKRCSPKLQRTNPPLISKCGSNGFYLTRHGIDIAKGLKSVRTS